MTNTNALCMGCLREKDNEGKCAACGFDESVHIPAPHHLPLRTILDGKYLTGRVLGEGGFGITYLGWDLNLDLKIAIKEYYPTGFVTRENTTTNTVTPYVGEKEAFFTKGRERFVDEAKSLAKFYTLPGIVSVKDFFLENGTAYIVMEFVGGQTLKQLLAQSGGKLPAGQVLEMMKPLMRSLSQIHKAGIIHRDISPDNIMVTKEGNVKLLDFGAARSFEDSGNRSMSVMLKPGYAPEEQYRSRGVQGPWTDVYALSATMYKAMTGETPMESIERIYSEKLIPPTKLGVTLCANAEAAILKALSVRAEDRFQSMAEFISALENATTDNKGDKKVLSAVLNKTVGISSPRSDGVQPGSVSWPQKLKTNKAWLAAAISIAVMIVALAVILPLTLIPSTTFQPSNDKGSTEDIGQLPHGTTVVPGLPTSSAKKNVKPSPSIKPTPTSTPTANQNQTQAERGNSTGNIVNLGRAAFDGEKLVVFDDMTQQFANLYKGYLYYVDARDEGRLYRTSLATNTKQCIVTATDIAYVNVLDEQIFYRSTKDAYSVHRCALDGSNDVKLSSMRAARLAAVDGYLYFANWDSGTEGLWQMDYNGKNLRQLYAGGDVPLFINVWGDTVYWASYKQKSCLARTSLTTGETKFATNITGAESLNVYDGRIYFFLNSTSVEQGIYSAATDFTDLRLVYAGKKISNINIANDTIYFRVNGADSSSSGTLVKCSLDGSAVN